MIYKLNIIKKCVYYQDFKNDIQAEYYKKMRRSPYRNYIKEKCDLENDVLYFSILDTKENINKILDHLSKTEVYKYLRYWIEEDHFNGMDLLKILSKDAHINSMLDKLNEILDMKEIITLGSDEEKYNVVIPDNDFNHIIKHIHKEYKGIKNIKRK